MHAFLVKFFYSTSGCSASGCSESICAARDCRLKKVSPHILHIYPSVRLDEGSEVDISSLYYMVMVVFTGYGGNEEIRCYTFLHVCVVIIHHFA